MSFTHLHVRSGYTFMESTITLPKLVQRAAELNFSALALTDHHVLHGAIEFYKLCVAADIKPLLGMTVSVVNDADQEYLMVLLAKNNAGYHELSQLSTLIQTEEWSTVPFNVLIEHTKNVVAILSLENSHVHTLLREQKIVQAKEILVEWVKRFPDFYIGVNEQYLSRYPAITNNFRHLVTDESFNLVAIHDVVYLRESDYLAYECLQAMKAGRRWSIPETSNNDGRYLQSKEQMITAHERFFPEAITNIEKIVATCEVDFQFGEPILPAYPVPSGESASAYLKKICQENMTKKYDNVTPKMTERLNYELSVIDHLSFSDYFLIVWDFVTFAKEQEIAVGPGRGSAAGSFVAYLLGITNVDPLKYNLLFERFLNPERESMPDIDIDFADHRRDEVIDYVREKYGQEHVAQIITFGTFGARSILRELFKTLGTAQQDIYFILNQIPAQANESLRYYILESESLKKYIKQSPELRVLFKIALTLEGLPRHASTHAAGVIISDQPLVNIVPLTRGSQETYMTQYAMDELEALGLLKIDFLGLRNLSMIERMVQSINFHRAKDDQLKVDQLPADDEKTFALLQAGRTDGVFQLESAGMKDVLRRLNPTSLEDIVAVNALYRPGPMQYISTFIRRKHGQESTTYLHDGMKSILAPTYGVLVYQEQMMQIVQKFANYSLGQADIFRRALSSHQEPLIKAHRQRFISAAQKLGHSESLATQVFNWLMKFSNYSFNRSHAVAYSKISYQLAYLKAHYPEHFYAVLLTSALSSEKRLNQYVLDMRRQSIELLPPSINRSYGQFTVEKGHLRMGLLAIKGVGYQAVQEIIAKRQNKPFKNLFDFCFRISLKIVNQKRIEQLILVGALDEFTSNRASMLATLGQAIDQAELFQEYEEHPSLFSDRLDFSETYVVRKDFPLLEKLTYEREYLGIYASSHPLVGERKKLSARGYVTLIEAAEREGKGAVKSVVIIQSIRKIRTRRGDQMAFVKLSDEFSEMDGVIFPDLFQQVQLWLDENIFVTAQGRIERRNHKLQFVLQSLKLFEWAKVAEADERLFIKVVSHSEKTALNIIKQAAEKFPGQTSVYVYLKDSGETYKLADTYNLTVNKQCQEFLAREFGQVNIALK